MLPMPREIHRMSNLRVGCRAPETRLTDMRKAAAHLAGPREIIFVAPIREARFGRNLHHDHPPLATTTFPQRRAVDSLPYDPEPIGFGCLRAQLGVSLAGFGDLVRIRIAIPGTKLHPIVMISMILMASAMVQVLSPGEPMPALKGEFLTGRPAVLPDVASGRVALLALGFTYDSRFAVEAWAGRFRRDFGDNPQVTFYEVPMIGGMARLGKWFIDSGMRRGTPRQDHENVITVYGGTDPWKQRLGFQSPNSAYLLLLDQRGIVRWRRSGEVDTQAYDELSIQVRALLK